MKAFDFSLAELLRVRQQQERALRWQQAQAQADLELVLAELARHQRALEQSCSLIDVAVQAEEGARMTQWEQSHRLIAALQSIQLKEQQARAQLESVSQDRCKAQQQVEILETLRQKQWESWRRESRRHEQIQLDEHGIRGWQSKLSRGKAQ